jgi:hypothetical protein
MHSELRYWSNEMTRFLSVILMVLAAHAADAQDSPIGNETPAADQASEKATAETAAAAAAEKDKEFKPPPGFLTKKRGNLVLYCMKDRTTGTRFTTEKCYDEDQMREYLLALEIQKRDVERIRATCTTASVCSPQ